MIREYYRRHLPHWQPTGAIFFVTFRLKGTLPVEVIQALKEEREREKKNVAKLPKDEQAKQDYVDERHYFSKWDNQLDKAEFGPRWLSQPEIAEIVKEALHYRDGKVFDLYAFCIMCNHAHVVFEPCEPCKSDCQSDLQQTGGSRIANPTYNKLVVSRIANPTYNKLVVSRIANPTYNKLVVSRIANPTYRCLWKKSCNL
jgi:hypothetical protein